MGHLFLFGPGYTGSRIAQRLQQSGWTVHSAHRTASGDGAFSIDDSQAINASLRQATHILSSVPPVGEIDPVLDRYGHSIAQSPARWIGYLSSTGVYGDTGGAYVDETAPIGHGRRLARTNADIAWQSLGEHVRIFRLPGIYGPERSPLDRVASGKAHRILLPGQVFSRIHVDDIVSGVLASIQTGPSGVYNLADNLPVSQNSVIEYAAQLLGIQPPPLLSLDEAKLSPAALAFYSENRRVSSQKAQRLLNWRPLYSDFREGLRALRAINSPKVASATPPIESPVQR